MFADAEKKLVEEVFNNAIDSLSDDDKNLPQVNTQYTYLHTAISAL
jgi:superfamily II RNA helicase